MSLTITKYLFFEPKKFKAKMPRKQLYPLRLGVFAPLL
jgi:hypothetical protein